MPGPLFLFILIELGFLDLEFSGFFVYRSTLSEYGSGLFGINDDLFAILHELELGIGVGFRKF